MAPIQEETQAQLLELIQGIKSAHERQNILLEKLVEVMGASANENEDRRDDNRGVNDTTEEALNANGESNDARKELNVEEPETSPAIHAPTNEQYKELDQRFGLLPDAFKSRIKIYSDSDNHERPILGIPHGTVKALDGFRRDPANGTELGCTTNDWKYWYPQGGSLILRDKYGATGFKHFYAGPVPDFIPWWELVRGGSEDVWYHVDDTERTQPIRCPFGPWSLDALTVTEVPYPFVPPPKQNPLWGSLIAPNGINMGRYQKVLDNTLGELYAVPPDGRLPLAFERNELRLKCGLDPANPDTSGLDEYLKRASELLQSLNGRVSVWDMAGEEKARYSVWGQSHLEASLESLPCYWEMAKTALRQEASGFLAPPVRIPVVGLVMPGASEISSFPGATVRDFPAPLKCSWCRVVHIQGLADVLAGLVEGDCNASTAMDVWRLLIHDGRPRTRQPWEQGRVVRQMFNQHLFCQRYTKPSTQEGGLPWRAFHVAWYELCREPTGEQVRKSTWKYGRLYGDDGQHIRQQALTVGCFYWDGVPGIWRPRPDETVWTMLVLSSGSSQQIGLDYPCRSNIFMLGHIHDGLRRAADAWDMIRSSLSSVTDTEPPILDPRQHDHLLFDDDTFSRSRQYFWVVNCLESFKTLIDDAVEEWIRLRGGWPSILQGTEEEEESQQALELLASVEAQVSRLREISARFAFTHERTKALREGLFSASGVIESRVSTRLGENVRLLTYVSIFYLPLSFCVALWSTNENYARPMLVLTSFLVAAATFLVVANLRNLTAIGTSLYRRLKRAIVRRMRDSQDEEWVRRAKAFEGYRPEREEVEPSEWYLLQFVLSWAFSRLASLKIRRVSASDASIWVSSSSSSSSEGGAGRASVATDQTQPRSSSRSEEV